MNDGTGRYNYSYMHSPPIVYRAGGDSSSNQFMNAAVKDNLGIVCLDPIVIADSTHQKLVRRSPKVSARKGFYQSPRKRLFKLDYISLDPIIINPDISRAPNVLNLRQTFAFPPNLKGPLHALQEHGTQTSKTLIEVYRLEKSTEDQSSQSVFPYNGDHAVPKHHPVVSSNGWTSAKTFHSFASGEPISKGERTPHANLPPSNLSTCNEIDNVQIVRILAPNKNFVESSNDNVLKYSCSCCNMNESHSAHSTTPRKTEKSSKPETTEVYKKVIRPVSVRKIANSVRRMESRNSASFSRKMQSNKATPKKRYSDGKNSVELKVTKSICLDNSCSSTASTYSNAVTVVSVLEKLNDSSWEVTLQGLNEILYLAPRIEWNKNPREVSLINRKLIELFRSPRTTICRIACQVAGELFHFIKSTKRPEFDEIVDLLLNKTADSNRFIQKDANIALDKMVTYIPPFHAVRALCSKGPMHKNPIVRIATARLLVCVCAISGIDGIIGPTANSQTRRRVLSNLSKFLTDKNHDARKFGERLCRILRKHKFFDEYFYKDLENNQKAMFKKIISSLPP